MKQKLLSLVLVLLLLSGCGVKAEDVLVQPGQNTTVPPTSQETTEATEPPATEPPTTEAQPESFLLTFAGDCTFGSQNAVYYAPWGFCKLVADDFAYPFQNVQDYFRNDDFSMVNLEGPLIDDGNPVEKKHAFRCPEKYVNILTQNSVEAVTTANNHTYDCSYRGYDSTIAVLQGAEVPYVEKADILLYTTERGLTIGIYAEEYTDMDMERLRSAVAQLRDLGAEIIVYAVHWGTEGSYYPQQNQVDWAHKAIDAGVDIVYGSHPHVLQNIEVYNGKVIFYSLGNFIFGGNMYPRDLDSAIVQQEIIRYGDGTVELGQLTVVPVSVSSIPERNNYQPTPYEVGTEEYDRVLEKLAGEWKGRALPVD